MKETRKPENMNTTVSGSGCSSPFNPAAAKIGKTFACCLILVVSLLGNSFIGIIVYKTHTLRKPMNFFIVNMAMSDLVYSIFLFLREFINLHSDSLTTNGPLSQALCKVNFFLALVCVTASTQSLILIAVDRFGAVVFPLRFPLISSKLCPFFILATWIIAMAVPTPYLLTSAKIVQNPRQQDRNVSTGGMKTLENPFLLTITSLRCLWYLFTFLSSC